MYILFRNRKNIEKEKNNIILESKKIFEKNENIYQNIIMNFYINIYQYNDANNDRNILIIYVF